MSQQNTQADNNNYKKILIKNSSCCGAASDAWVPSYPSLPIRIDTFFSKNQSLSDKSEPESSSLLSNDNKFL
jgi:hypothetical protein